MVSNISSFQGTIVDNINDNKCNPFTDGKSAKDAVRKALGNLETVFTAIGTKYSESVENDDYERFEDKIMDMAAIKKMTAGDPDALAPTAAAADTTMETS